MKIKKQSIVIVLIFAIALVAIEYNHIVNFFRACQKEVIQNRISRTLENNFNMIESFETIVYFRDSDENYIQLIIQTIETYYPLLKKDFDMKSIGKVTVVVYPSKELLQDTLKLEYTNTPMGVFYGGVLNILSPNIWLDGSEASIKSSFLKDGPLVHELVHYVLDAKTKGNYPLWFTEGAALFYEKKYTGFEWHPELEQASRKITIDELQKNFLSLNEFLAYRKAYEVVADLSDKHGEVYIQQLMIELANGISQKKFNSIVK